MLQTNEFKPRLACQILLEGDEIVLARDDYRYVIEPDDSSAEDLRMVFSRLDGTNSLAAIHESLNAPHRKLFTSVIEDLDRHGLIDDTSTVQLRSGTQALLEIEDLTNSLLEKTLNKNVFWEHILMNPGACPASAFFGLAIENYHFLYRESLFDSPVLPFLASSKARHLINSFYVSEYGHDELVYQALNALGMNRADVEDSLPLPETLALCNALSYWAANDPVFFFTTLGVLEGTDAAVDLYIDACEKKGLPESFIGPMRAHSDINRNAEHGNLTRLIFSEIPLIDDETQARMRRQTRLFIEMYDDFYTAIWKFYSTRTHLVRRMSAI